MINLISGDRDDAFGGLSIDAYSISLLNPDSLSLEQDEKFAQ